MLARLAFFLLLIAPPIALAADAPPGGGKITVPPAPRVAAAPAPAPPAMSPLPAAAAEDPSDCRMDCAQRYYVCRGGEQPDDCGGGWGQCVAACNSPNLAPPTAPAP
jgi:hypothetical protein